MKGIIFFLLIVFGVLPTYAKIQFKISHVVKDDSPKGEAIRIFKEELEQLSKGEIGVTIYSNGILFNDREALLALKNGLIQFAVPSFSKLADVVSEFQIYDIPYLFDDLGHIHESYFGKIGEILRKKAEENGIVLLALWDNGFKVITNSKKVIKTPYDLKGLRIRTQGSRVINKSLELAGAKPVSKPFNVVIDLLKSGLIDGQQNTFSNIYTQGFYKYQKYMTLVKHGFLGYAFLTGKKFWESLDISVKNMVLTALERATFVEYELAKEKNEEDFYKIKLSSSIKIVELDSKDEMEWKEFYRKRLDVFKRLMKNGEIIEEVLKLK